VGSHIGNDCQSLNGGYGGGCGDLMIDIGPVQLQFSSSSIALGDYSPLGGKKAQWEKKTHLPWEKKGEKRYLKPLNELKLAKGAFKACPKVGEGYEEWVSQCRLSS
jgi:hypothetical protein